LFLLSAGSHCPNPAALFGSPAMRGLLASLCEQYDRVLLDSPPIMPVSDATALATMVDGVLMIVGASTSKRIVHRACTLLRQVGARIYGIALNRVDATSPAYYYYSPYKSYYYRKETTQ
jgi:Mrp family chromosome partitioning ATPase